MDKKAAVEQSEAFESHNVHGRAHCLLLCDHASNHIPAPYGQLGLPSQDMTRHIAWDIGAAELTRALATCLDAPALLARFSRLVIDPNRGLDDPTLVMRLYDRGVIPGNRMVDDAEIKRRADLFYAPYDNAITTAIDLKMKRGLPPALISVHSFTPEFKGQARPWDIGILWNGFDGRLALPLMERLTRHDKLCVGDNLPYSGALPGDTLDRHAAARGLAHVLIEIRHDLVAAPEKILPLAQFLAAEIKPFLADGRLLRVAHFQRP